MIQCASCASFNDEGAAFCGQCGAPLGRRGRGARGARLRAGVRIVLIAAASAGIAYVLWTLRTPEPAPLADLPDASGRTAQDEPAAGASAAKDVEPAGAAAAAPAAEPQGSQPLDPKAAIALARKALVTLELKGRGGRVLREEPGLIVDLEGVVLARYRSLLGAYEGTCLLPGSEGRRLEILGISYRHEILDLALLRVAPPPPGYGAVPILPGDPDRAPLPGDPVFVFAWDQAVETSVAESDHVSPDGLSRALLAESPELPQNPFLALDASGFAIGLCRLESPWALYPPARGPPPRECRAVVDGAAPLIEALDLPAAVTLSAITRAYYEGSFADFFEQGLRAARRSAWKEAIDLLRQALDRAAIDRPEDADLELAIATLKSAFYEEVNRLAGEGREAEAASLAEEAADRFPDEVVFLVRAGELRYARREWAAGTDALVRARRLWSSPDLDALLEEGYLQLAAQADLRGDRAARQASLVEGMKELPASGRLALELAKAYFDLGAYGEASSLLLRSKELSSSLAAEADALLARIDDILKRREAVVVPFDPDGRSIRVEGSVDGVRALNLIIDTGATYTAIPLHVAQELGYGDAIAKAPTLSVNTAGGTFLTRRIQIRSLSVGRFFVRDLEVLVLPEPSGEEYGLLGLNFLRHFRYIVDATRKEFRIERP